MKLVIASNHASWGSNLLGVTSILELDPEMTTDEFFIRSRQTIQTIMDKELGEVEFNENTTENEFHKLMELCKVQVVSLYDPKYFVVLKNPESAIPHVFSFSVVQ